jgi:cobalamin biosynthesis protein CobT
MTPEPKNKASWLDDITELIRKKREENRALRKVQESLQSMGKGKDISGESHSDEEEANDKINEDQPVNNEKESYLFVFCLDDQWDNIWSAQRAEDHRS